MDKQGIKPIHPFPARMAPEIAFAALKDIKKGATVLDPMVGSGTVLRTIAELGHNGIGFDIDPLAVLMSKAWTTKMNNKNFVRKVEQILKRTKKLKVKTTKLSWIDKDKRTKEFVAFWFAHNWPLPAQSVSGCSGIATYAQLRAPPGWPAAKATRVSR